MFRDEVQETLSSTGLLIMRVWIGLNMMIAHGWPKLAGFSERAPKFLDPFGLGSELSLALAIGAEFFGSILIILGLGTRLVSVPLLVTMLVAAFIAHGGDPWRVKEVALLFGFVYVQFLFTGPGKFSLDHIIARRRRAMAPKAS